MKHFLILRLIALLLIVTVPVAIAIVVVPASVVVADDDDEQDEDEDGDEDDNGNRGNNGHRGNAGNNGNDDNRGNNKIVESIEGYTVDVSCEYDADVGQTTCEVLATAPADGKKVGFVQVPAAGLCAEVIESGAEYVDEDPHTQLEGYKSRGNDRGFSLVFDGEVTASGTAEYWIKAVNNVFPVNGPGMECPEAAAEPTANPTEAPATGELLVKTYHCDGEPADRAAFDWFGECQPGDVSNPYLLGLVGDESSISAEADDAGEATFPDLAPGTWWLEINDASWCHANSDKVTAEGELVIDAGETTTVWIFLCEGTPGE